MQVASRWAVRSLLVAASRGYAHSGELPEVWNQGQMKEGLGQLRPTVAKVSLDALDENLFAFYRHLRPRVKQAQLLPVVKANGYGHGALPLTLRALQLRENGEKVVAGVAVATLEEAILLRKQLDHLGVECPFLLLLGVLPKGSEELAIQYKVTPSLCTIESLQRCAEASAKASKPMRVHIKLDTGMHRVGLMEEELPRAIRELQQAEFLQVEGVYTHLSKADEEDKGYTFQQLSCFQRGVDRLKESDIRPALLHSMNSAGSVEFAELAEQLPFIQDLNLFRIGISLYGLYPSQEVRKQEVPLRPLLQWESSVVQVKQLAKGSLIGYGGSYETKEEQTIAVLPVGYADGYRRLLGASANANAFHVHMKGKDCPIVGRVCMDMIMVDASAVPNVKEGDQAILLGPAVPGLHCDDMANRLSTLNYEVTCLIGERVPRIFQLKGETVALGSLFGNSITNQLLKKES
jgi:alanine racemase